jgi:hypothetical protein
LATSGGDERILCAGLDIKPELCWIYTYIYILMDININIYIHTYPLVIEYRNAKPAFCINHRTRLEKTASPQHEVVELLRPGGQVGRQPIGSDAIDILTQLGEHIQKKQAGKDM